MTIKVILLSILLNRHHDNSRVEMSRIVIRHWFNLKFAQLGSDDFSIVEYLLLFNYIKFIYHSFYDCSGVSSFGKLLRLC